jgi:nucleotide-binding universal stress UspA family protein
MMERVLVPHDGTELCDLALQAVQALGVDSGRVHVVHVLPRLDLTRPDIHWPPDLDQMRCAEARAALAQRFDGGPFGSATVHAVVGEPATRVVETARALKATLIVMPTHGRRDLDRLVLGSVAEHVVRFSSCPVLVLPKSDLLEHHPKAEPVAPREDQVQSIAHLLGQRATESRAYLTGARVEVGPDEDLEWWEDTLDELLLDQGIEFVDLVVVHGRSRTARVVSVQLEERFA